MAGILVWHFSGAFGGDCLVGNQSFFGFFARLFVNGAAVDPDLVTPLPTATLLSNSGFSKNGNAWQWLGLFAAMTLVAYGNEDTVMRTTSGLVQSYKFYGVFLFWLLGILWAWQAPRQSLAWSKLGALLRSKLAAG